MNEPQITRESAATVAWMDDLRRRERLPQTYPAMVRPLLAQLATRIAALRQSGSRPVVIGLNGAQGSGKSTLALFLSHWLNREAQLATAILALDDLYLGQAARAVLARQQHPLLVTRGVPGTHEVALGQRLLEQLTDPSRAAAVVLPRFDKAADDRRPPTGWRTVAVPVEVVILEGWCVGARPQAVEQLVTPVNALEIAEDADGRWRAYVNHQLQTDYAEWFSRLDALVMLRVPGFEQVLEWRGLQEHKRAGAAAAQGLSNPQLQRFIMHYERLTRHMLESMPTDADTLVDLDADHRVAAVAHPGWTR